MRRERRYRITSAARSARADRRRRMGLYFTLMTLCLLLIVLAWFWVRLFSTPAAVAMSVVGLAIPPVAAIVGNRP